MSKSYEAPVVVRELEQLISRFAYQHGFDNKNVFHDFLRYVVNGFSIPGSPSLTDWKYTKEQTVAFYEMMAAWVRIMEKQIKIHGWYDALGPLFLTLTSSMEQQNKGQFFTPQEVSNLAAKLTMDDDAQIPTILDPAVGSGGMIISAKEKAPRSFLVGWDIDYTCCMMCVCNFLINSCVGEVVCIDSLSLNNFRGAWIVNGSYYRTGAPSVYWLNEQEYLLYKQAKIPAYVFFLDQEKYDQYFESRRLWAQCMAILDKVKER